MPPYQVKADDKDFLTLAANLNVPYNQLKAANPYVQSLSQGQFINIPFGQTTGTAGGFTAAARNVAQNYQPPAFPDAGGGRGAMLPSRTPPPVTPNLQANAWIAAQTQKAPGTNQAYADYAQRQGVAGFNIEALANQFSLTHTLPPNTPQPVIDYLISQGAEPALIQQAMAKGAQSAAAANDPLAGTPGHYYVDEKSAPFVGQIITRKDGTRRRLLADNTGRLYYAKPGASGRAMSRRFENRRTNAANAAAALAAQQAAELAAQVRGDNATTVLNVILGS